MNRASKWVALLAFLSPILGWLAERRYRQMPKLDSSQGLEQQTQYLRLDGEVAKLSSGRLPSVSIIVPARNEAQNLLQLLPSLAELQYSGQLELIVVDDNSTDETAVIAKNHGANVLSLTELPDGWLGKPHACHRASEMATGEWLLFTDADTIHTRDGLSHAVSYAIEHQLHGLSCHLHHKTNGLLDSLALTTAFAGLFAGLSKQHASLNGQYILIRRDVYLASGGFAAVRNQPLEDLAFGHLLYHQGYRVPMLRGEEIAEVAMYKSNRHLWQGMTRIGAGSLRWSGVGSLMTALFITALMTPLLVWQLVRRRQLPRRWLYLTWGTAVAGAWPWSRRFDLRWRALFTPFGALFVQLSAMWGLVSRLLGRGVRWKGRVV